MIRHRIVNGAEAPVRLLIRILLLALAACAHQRDVSPAAPQAPGSAGASGDRSSSNRRRRPPPAASAEPARDRPKLEPAVVLKDVGIHDAGVRALRPGAGRVLREQHQRQSRRRRRQRLHLQGEPRRQGARPEVGRRHEEGLRRSNAPKGLGVSGNLLYVADLTFVRMFDRKTGAPKGKIAIPGATFLNDVDHRDRTEPSTSPTAGSSSARTASSRRERTPSTRSARATRSRRSSPTRRGRTRTASSRTTRACGSSRSARASSTESGRTARRTPAQKLPVRRARRHREALGRHACSFRAGARPRCIAVPPAARSRS